jgi:transcriptional regulator with XRE-family HTH domain
MATRSGGKDRISTKARLAEEIAVLGQLLTRVRERRGLKQQELATKLQMPASYLSKIENGTRRLDVIELVAIAEAMDVDAADIVRELQSLLKEAPARAR